VKGTGIGQKVKGKESERTLKGRYVWMVYGIWRSVTDYNLLQIGKETAGYAGDAADGADVERGMLYNF